MNILITSAGRRGYIVQYFKKVIGNTDKVFVGNSDECSAAFYYADDFVVTPLIYAENYIGFLINYCKKKNIKIIISLFDVDLLILSQNKSVFEQEGITVIVSDEKVIRTCNDKWGTYEFCKKNAILTPKSYIYFEEIKKDILQGALEFPLIVKPRWGMGSLVVYKADNMDELEILYRKCKSDIQNTYLKYEATFDIENCVIVQEFIDGQEYGMDVVNDLEKKFCINVIRKKYAMRSGETDCAVVVKNKKIDLLGKQISCKLGHIANLDVDLFIKGEDIYLLEMNARFGGGYPFSHMAGINLPAAILKWVKGESAAEELRIKEYGRIIQKDIGFVDLTDIIEKANVV